MTQQEIEYSKKDFHILRCAQPDGIGYINDDRALELMRLGLLHDNPREKWSENGYKATHEGIKLYQKWLRNIRGKHKHIWKRSEYDQDKIDNFAYESGDYHNGPRCVLCGYGYCVHCTDEADIVECSTSLREKQERISVLKREIDEIQRSI